MAKAALQGTGNHRETELTKKPIARPGGYEGRKGARMLWKMSGWTEAATARWSETKEKVETYIEAESMDEAFRIAREIYGSGIDTAQPAN